MCFCHQDSTRQYTPRFARLSLKNAAAGEEQRPSPQRTQRTQRTALTWLTAQRRDPSAALRVTDARRSLSACFRERKHGGRRADFRAAGLQTHRVSATRRGGSGPPNTGAGSRRAEWGDPTDTIAGARPGLHGREDVLAQAKAWHPAQESRRAEWGGATDMIAAGHGTSRSRARGARPGLHGREGNLPLAACLGVHSHPVASPFLAMTKMSPR